MGNLVLTDRMGVFRKDGATKISGTDPLGQLIGRSGSWRLERYKFVPTESITKILFHFEAYYDKKVGTYYNFTHYSGKDLRDKGVKAFISTKIDMSDWEQFSPVSIPNNIKHRVCTLNFKNDYTILEGRIDLSQSPLEKGQTYYVFFFTENTSTDSGAIWWTNTPDSTIENPKNLSTYESYTACTAPTIFKFKNNLLTSGFSVTWGGAEPGANNPITGYELKFGWNNKLVSLSSGVKEYYYDFLDSNENLEGKNIEVSIRTVGTRAEAKYSSWVPISGKINYRPTSPVVTPSYQGDGIFGAGEVKFFVGGSSDADGDTVRYFYQINDGQELEIGGGSFSYELEQSTLFSFFAKDSKGECSPSVKINAKVYSLNVDMQPISKCKRLFDGEEKESVTIAKFVFDTTANVKAEFACEKTVQEFTSNSGEPLTLDFISILGGLPSELANYTVSFMPISADGTEIRRSNGERAQIVCNGLLFPVPSMNDSEVFDQFGKNENIYNDSDKKCFFKEVRIKLPPFDPSIKNYDASISFGEKTIKSVTKFVEEEENNWYFEASLPVSDNGASEELSIKLLHNTIIYTINLGKYLQIASFSFTNLKSEWSECPIAYDRPQFQLTCAYQDFEKCGIASYQPSGFGNSIQFTAEIKHNEETYTLEKLRATQGGKNDLYPNNSTLYFYFDFFKERNENTVEDILRGLGIETTSYFGVKEFIVTLIIVNVYGESYTKSIPLLISFDKAPELSKPALKLLTSEVKEINSKDPEFKYLEGMKLRIDYEVKKWSYSDNWQMLIKSKDGGAVLHSSSCSESPNSFDGSISSQSVTFQVPQISALETWNPTIQLIAANTASSDALITNFEYETFLVKNKTVNLISANYENNEFIINFDYSEKDNGTEIHSFLMVNGLDVGEIVENRIEYAFNDDSATVFVKTEETATNSGYTLIKTWFSNSLVAYNLLPTISYRKNRLGINTKNMDEDSVLYVARANNAKYVTFKIQDDNGTIDRELTIDLYNGAINNAIMDGGSWDGTPGEIIPGGSSGEIPGGLAAIAYSGEISDLIQNSKEVIIFAGGSAPIEKI